MKIRFISLASGSSGNCYYLGTETYGILIDAGIPSRTIRKTLKDFGIGIETIRAVFITHDHADHIKAVGGWGEKLCIPIYATARVQPPSDKGKRLKLYYMTQASTKPPAFVVFCNNKELFHYSYQRYIENQIREAFSLDATPIRIIVRERGE